MAVRARAFACWFGRWRRQRRQTGQGEQEFVRGIEEVEVSFHRTVRRSEEDRGMPRVVDGDIGLEACATARFFNDVRWRVDWQDMNPSETNTGRFAGMVESLLAYEMRGNNVDGLSVRIQRGSSCRHPCRADIGARSPYRLRWSTVRSFRQWPRSRCMFLRRGR